MRPSNKFEKKDLDFRRSSRRRALPVSVLFFFTLSTLLWWSGQSFRFEHLYTIDYLLCVLCCPEKHHHHQERLTWSTNDQNRPTDLFLSFFKSENGMNTHRERKSFGLACLLFFAAGFCTFLHCLIVCMGCLCMHGEGQAFLFGWAWAWQCDSHRVLFLVLLLLLT